MTPSTESVQRLAGVALTVLPVKSFSWLEAMPVSEPEALSRPQARLA